jgi:LPS-assembly lipoprotein
MQLARFVPILFIAALLSGCGFQLRGATEIPPELSPIFVQASGGSRVGRALQIALRGGSAEVTTSSQEAATVIRILEESQDERINAVNSQGKVIAKDLLYRVSFDAIQADGGQLAQRQTIKLNREQVYPEGEVIGKAEEAEQIRRDMAEDMADRILRRLKAQLL